MRWLRCLDCWQPAERSERFPGLWWWRAALRPMVKLRGGTWLTPWVCAKIGYPTSQQKWSIYQETIGLGGTTICAHTHMLTPRFPNEMLCGFPWIQLWCKHEHTRKLWTLFVTVYSKGSVQPCPAMSSHVQPAFQVSSRNILVWHGSPSTTGDPFWHQRSSPPRWRATSKWRMFAPTCSYLLCPVCSVVQEAGWHQLFVNSLVPSSLQVWHNKSWSHFSGSG